ncbi:hypothetical protein PTTG_05817 [Puccinia triticina 1-1 BBBD Race 1]|uniref:Uncharacterized protein n=1 Tax=Puccinia triticina (isolate 1-1 / race 1 (BBBD)) TaxID=630390 RepID=A0A0C4EYB7_PUCT1|nr:hypothetical protein PTTG_05817 [Puccinia triticina 1-1 BBBD Race 1]
MPAKDQTPLQQARPAYQVPQTEMEGEPTQDHTNKALQGAGRPSPSATTILQKGLNTSNAPPKNTSASPIKTAAAAQMTTTDLPAPGSTSVTPATQSKVLPPTNDSAQLDTNPSTKPPPQLFMPKCLSAVLTPMHKASISQTPSTSTTLGCTIGIPNIATASLEQMKVLKDIWERNREPMAKTVEDLQANNLDQKIPQAYDMAVHNFRCISRFCIQFNFGTSQQEASQPCLWEARNGGSGAHKEHPHNCPPQPLLKIQPALLQINSTQNPRRPLIIHNKALPPLRSPHQDPQSRFLESQGPSSPHPKTAIPIYDHKLKMKAQKRSNKERVRKPTSDSGGSKRVAHEEPTVPATSQAATSTTKTGKDQLEKVPAVE